MAGVANSWIEQYTTQQTPCINGSGGSSGSSTFSSCLVWLLVGLVLGSITFQKKGSQQ
jgi:hypothetical protein